MTRTTACTAPRRVSLLMTAARHAEIAAWAEERGLSLSASVRLLAGCGLHEQRRLALVAVGGGAGESPTPPQPPAV